MYLASRPTVHTVCRAINLLYYGGVIIKHLIKSTAERPWSGTNREGSHKHRYYNTAWIRIYLLYSSFRSTYNTYLMEPCTGQSGGCGATGRHHRQRWTMHVKLRCAPSSRRSRRRTVRRGYSIVLYLYIWKVAVHCDVQRHGSRARSCTYYKQELSGFPKGD